MRVSSLSASRVVGYVHVQVASRVYVLPVEERPPTVADGSALRAGFSAQAGGRFAILVDREASAAVVNATIDRAKADAAIHISRSVLN